MFPTMENQLTFGITCSRLVITAAVPFTPPYAPRNSASMFPRDGGGRLASYEESRGRSVQPRVQGRSSRLLIGLAIVLNGHLFAATLPIDPAASRS